MASIRVLSCAILLSLVLESVYGNVPVLLWESSKSERTSSFPALHTINNEEFQEYMLKKVLGGKHTPLVVFIADSLSMEDYSGKDSQGQVYLPQLQNITDTAASVLFIPSVQKPIKAIFELSKSNGIVKEIDTDQSSDIPEVGLCGKITLKVKLPKAKPDEDRPELLRRYDEIITLIYRKLLSKCSHVIGILSAKMRSYTMISEEVSRLRRAADDGNNTSLTVDGPHIAYRDNQGLSLLYSGNLPKLTQNGQEVQIENKTVTVSGDKKPTDIKLVVKYGADQWLTFNFDNETYGYWTLRSVEYKENNKPSIILKSSLNIQAPTGQSYHSGTPVIFRDRETDTVLTFENLQVQPFFMNPGSNSFGEAVDAVEFFTPAIWSGIFVTFLLAIIFTWGISMIMDIRTMDQFDDPKGKTITVSATD